MSAVTANWPVRSTVRVRVAETRTTGILASPLVSWSDGPAKAITNAAVKRTKTFFMATTPLIRTNRSRKRLACWLARTGRWRLRGQRELLEDGQLGRLNPGDATLFLEDAAG